MWDWLNRPTGQAVLAGLVLVAIVVVSLKLVVRLRRAICKADTSADDPLRNFEEMRLGGDISDEELRRISAVLGKSRDARTSE